MQTKPEQMTRIEYSKYFLSGTLEGLSVRCHFSVPTQEAHKVSMNLARVTRQNPSEDVITGARYYIYNVGSMPAEAAK